jgi:hypothetical protein
MKAITLLFFFLITANVFAQSEKINHLEIGVQALFWTPTDKHMKASNTLLETDSKTAYTKPMPYFDGYGSCLAPSFHINYYFKDYLGISLGFDYLHIINHLEFEDASSLYTGETNVFHNEAKIYNIKLGYVGQTNDTSVIHIYYGLGLNFSPSYSLFYGQQHYYEQPAYTAKDIAFGLYINAGIQIQLFKFTYLSMGMEYSYIPENVLYIASSYTSQFEEKTNLGGIAGQLGIVVKLLNY